MPKFSGIVLHRIKYSESSLIIRILTREQGLISGIARGVRKNKKKGFIYQAGNLVQVECFKKPSNDIYTIKECAMERLYQNILVDISKNMMITFLCEVLLKTIEEEHTDEDLFRFVASQFLFLDEIQPLFVKEFHIHFLIGLTKYLGFSPENNYQSGFIFNLSSGKFSPQISGGDIITSNSLALFLNKKSDALILLDKKENRKNLVALLLQYYKTHLDGLGQIKSLEVLESISA